jgi:hypothetical protein
MNVPAIGKRQRTGSSGLLHVHLDWAKLRWERHSMQWLRLFRKYSLAQE